MQPEHVDGLASAVAILPTEAQRAYFRLLTDGIVARHHLGHLDTSGWPGFVTVGPTKTGKSLMTFGACRLFGLDPILHVRSTPAETERSLWGRRYQIGGGEWGFRPASILASPFLALDEFDKAPQPVRRACLKLFQGDTRVPAEEGDVVEVRPTVVILANGGADVIPPEYRRRSVVLDTASLVDSLGDLNRSARHFLAALPAGLDLGGLVPPVGRLPDDLADLMVAVLREGLTDAGWRAVDERALAHLALGRAALGRAVMTGAPLAETVLAAAGDYLTVAATVGEAAIALPVQVPDRAARQAESERRAADDAGRRRLARQTELDLAGAKATVARKLGSLIPDPDDFPVSAAGAVADLAGRIGCLVEWVHGAETQAELDELVALAGDTIREAGAERLGRPAELASVEVGDEGWERDDEEWSHEGSVADGAIRVAAVVVPALAAYRAQARAIPATAVVVEATKLVMRSVTTARCVTCGAHAAFVVTNDHGMEAATCRAHQATTMETVGPDATIARPI